MAVRLTDHYDRAGNIANNAAPTSTTTNVEVAKIHAILALADALHRVASVIEDTIESRGDA